MKKKNKLPIKWILGILVILITVAYWTNLQTQSKNQGILSASSNFYSQNNFFQFLEHLIGMGSSNNSPLSENENISNRYNPNLSQRKNPNTADQLHQNSIPAANPLGSGNSETNVNQETGNLSGTNVENNLGINAESNSEFNAENPSGINAENNLGNNPEMNAETNAETNAESNAGENAETSQANGPDNTSGGISGGSTGGDSGNNSGNGLGCFEGCYPQCSPGCPWNINPSAANNPSNPSNPSNLPTINPIPSNDIASQSIAQQNKQNAALAALIAARQAIADQVRQAAEATKYQTVSSGSITPADTTPPNEDTVTKIKERQLFFL